VFVDSHCHLSFPGLAEQLPVIRADMRAADVGAALCICTTLEEFEDVHALACSDNNFWASAGVHPDNEGVLEPSVKDLLRLAEHAKVVAIGETGLDYYRLNGRTVAEMEWQRERFRVHIQAAQHTGLPLVIHTRTASKDTLDVLTAEGEGRVGGVFHCFTETLEVARAALDLGFYISFSGILTFKNAHDLREVASFVPLDRCLIETDSPYLAPAPFRGKTNTPALLPWVAKQVAELKGIAVEDIARITTLNFERLFGVSITASTTR
jgi:TatD DNase family protein